MTPGCKSKCENCGADTTMSGYEICPTCDPDIDAIIDGRAAKKSPDLCEKCFKEHKEQHELLNRALS